MKKSDHFDGKRFFNPSGATVPDFSAIIKWQFEGGRSKWPTSRPNTARPQLNLSLEPGQVAATFVNHATHLLQYPGLNVLTDPVFSPRTSPVSWAGPLRAREPGVKLSELPKIDVVLISHNHFDHMDTASVRELCERFDPLFIVPLENKKLITPMGAKRVIELDWWENTEHQGAIFTLVPAQHWSRRGAFDTNVALWGGFIVEANHTATFFAGDTGYGPHFKEIQKRFPKIDLSLLPIGAYEPRWFMRSQHMNPEDAVLAHLDLQTRFSVGIHFGTFQLTNEGIDDPVRDLAEARKKHQVSESVFLIQEQGETTVFTRPKN